MPKYPQNHKDVEYFMPGRKKRIAGSTKDTSDFLAYVHGDNPTLTIAQLRELITDCSKYIFQPEAVEVLNAYIKAGYMETMCQHGDKYFILAKHLLVAC